jgi:hypothetical protein
MLLAATPQSKRETGLLTTTGYETGQEVQPRIHKTHPKQLTIYKAQMFRSCINKIKTNKWELWNQLTKSQTRTPVHLRIL